MGVHRRLVWDEFEEAKEEPNIDIPAEVDTVSVPVALRYFSPLGIFGQIGVAFVHQDVARRAASTTPEGSDDFVVLDAAVGYRLPRRKGILSLEATSLLDSRFDFQDDYRSNEPKTPALPARANDPRAADPDLHNSTKKGDGAIRAPAARPPSAWHEAQRLLGSRRGLAGITAGVALGGMIIGNLERRNLAVPATRRRASRTPR